MTEEMSCPCKSGSLYSNCCQPLLNGKQSARTAEALMRSRYTGYVTKNVEYLRRTWHPSTRPTQIDPTTIPQWCNLHVVNTRKGRESDSTGVVEFHATFLSPKGPQILHEISTFVKDKDLWYYLDGNILNESPSSQESRRVGRNEPCPCGSGKKSKKCCGP